MRSQLFSPSSSNNFSQLIPLHIPYFYIFCCPSSSLVLPPSLPMSLFSRSIPFLISFLFVSPFVPLFHASFCCHGDRNKKQSFTSTLNNKRRLHWLPSFYDRSQFVSSHMLDFPPQTLSGRFPHLSKAPLPQTLKQHNGTWNPTQKSF